MRLYSIAFISVKLLSHSIPSFVCTLTSFQWNALAFSPLIVRVWFYVSIKHCIIEVFLCFVVPVCEWVNGCVWVYVCGVRVCVWCNVHRHIWTVNLIWSEISFILKCGTANWEQRFWSLFTKFKWENAEYFHSDVPGMLIMENFTVEEERKLRAKWMG